ncbi:transposase [Streptomyces sp. NPDC002602]|uniref:transposase n=1 Tax=Streptomyces sp. NPDC002602 TaxID=3364654 RepID=UPI0036B79095
MLLGSEDSSGDKIPDIWGVRNDGVHLFSGRLHVVLDKSSPHKHPNVRAWAAANKVELVFLPTYGSWLNWIESEFAALRHFALNGTDHRSRDEQNTAINAYIRRHNSRAEPKGNFARESPIRGCVTSH